MVASGRALDDGVWSPFGLSREALAEACDLDRTYISGIERGSRNPSLTNILKIAVALNARPADLLARAEDLQRPARHA
jgi:transcriptional regulator with XRE-family HTH domain